MSGYYPSSPRPTASGTHIYEGLNLGSRSGARAYTGDPDQLWRVAIHEAAHFVIGDRVGVPLGIVSIRATASYAGVCGGRYPVGISELDVNRLLVEQPARARRAHEARIRWRLAGLAADKLYFPRSGFVRTPRPVEPSSFPDLSPAAAAQLVELETEGNGPKSVFVHDEDAALHYCFVLVGSKRAAAYYAWAVADTEAMVSEDHSRITRLAEALMDRKALSPRDARIVSRGSAA